MKYAGHYDAAYYCQQMQEDVTPPCIAEGLPTMNRRGMRISLGEGDCSYAERKRQNSIRYIRSKRQKEKKSLQEQIFMPIRLTPPTPTYR